MTANSSRFRRRKQGRVDRTLAVRVWRGVGSRVALMVLGISLLAYWQIYRILKRGVDDQLTSYMEQRVRRESLWFDHLLNQHKQLRDEFIARYQRITKDPQEKARALALFDQYYEVRPDGRVIVRPEFFEPAPDTTEARPRWISGGLDKTFPLTEDMRLRHALGLMMVAEHGPDVSRDPSETGPGASPFIDLYFLAPEESSVVYWPKVNWRFFANPEFRFPGHAYFDLSTPQHNPTRESRWSDVYFDEVASIWLISCITPVDLDGRSLVSFGTDVEIGSLQARVAEPGIAGSRTIIFDEAGRVVAGAELADAIQKKGGGFNLATDGDAAARDLLQKVSDHQGRTGVIDDPVHHRLLVLGRISGTEFNLVTICPRSLLTVPAIESALLILGTGGLSLLILGRVLKTHVSAPIGALLDATERVASGDLSPRANGALPTRRADEVGHLARAFDEMTHRLQDARDTVEERVAELSSVSNRLRLATQAAKIGIWDWDVVNNRLVWDDEMYQLYGITREDFSGAYEAWANALAPGDFERVNEEIQTALRGEREFITEFRILWPDGSVHYIGAQSQTFRDATGKPLRMVGVNYDITERKMAEEELRQLNATLEGRIIERTKELDTARVHAETASQAKSAFLAAMSHEIRTPMNAVLNMVGTVLETTLESEQREYLSVAEGSARHLLTIINDILDFSKIESGKLEIEDIPFSLHELLEGLADMFRDKITKKGVEFVLNLPPDLPDGLRGDPTRLRQILVNLIDNAFKFTSKGQVVLAASQLNDRVQLVVADTGIGISEEQQSQLFRPFSQLDVSIARKFGGTGLGLTISRRLAQLMGGDIHLSSVVGEGATFTVDLPLRRDAAGDRSSTRFSKASANRSVLLIDDNDTSREILATLLKHHGISCTSFSAVEPALDWLKSQAVDGVGAAFVDWKLDPKGMDGLEGIAALRKVREHMRCFLITAFVDSDLEESARAAGAADVLAKPIRSAELHAALQSVFDREQAAAPVESAAPLFAGKLALLAEDNPQNQLVAKVLLKKLGMGVEMAENGRIALELARENPGKYDVVLMDVQMPEMDGLEATRRIRALGDERLSEIPIIAMTASAMTADVAACLEAGMNGFVPKPVDKLALVAELRKVLASLPAGTGASL